MMVVIVEAAQDLHHLLLYILARMVSVVTV